ncbi:MAG: multifunctional CCA addition/repair protein [Pseudomonadota bacterium]
MSVTDNLNVYLVGGAVRDRLLGLPVKDRDWVVVGATPEDMSARGFRQVGHDFPVFLHPETGEEYALARTERKTGSGHQAFAFDTTASVTLEEDLERRDFTINAIAETSDGQLVDPYGGRQDLDDRVLRHISPAFSEDPLRVLRAARFAARFAAEGLTIAPETLQLLANMVATGELNDLTAERVWQETERALGTDHPTIYLQVLRACGALAVLFPEIERLFGVPQPEQWHPEIDTGVHTFMVLTQAARLSQDVTVRFAALTHDLGKADTPPAEWPSHKGHERASVARVRALCERLRTPKRFERLASAVAEYHGHVHKALELQPKTLLKVLDAVGAFRDAEQLTRFLLACEADARGRPGFEARAYPQRALVEAAFAAAASVANAEIAAEGHTGAAFGEALRLKRIAAIKQAVRDFQTST